MSDDDFIIQGCVPGFHGIERKRHCRRVNCHPRVAFRGDKALGEYFTLFRSVVELASFIPPPILNRNS